MAADVDCVVVPASALGGPAVLALLSQPHTLVVAVEDNTSAMRATAGALGLGVGSGAGAGRDGAGARVVTARSYAEAAGLMAAHKAGILLPSLTAAVAPLELERLGARTRAQHD